MSSTPRNLAEIEDREPFDYYDELRSAGDFVWEQAIDTWLAPTYAAAKQVLLEEDIFPRPTPREVSGERYERVLGKRNLTALRGQERVKLRRWWIRLLAPRVVDELRRDLVRQVIDAQIDRFAGDGKVDLVHEYTRRVSVRVISGLLGMPWQDDQWVEQMRAAMDPVDVYRSTVHLGFDVDVAEAALDGTYRMDKLARPYLEAARNGQGSEVAAKIWHEAPLDGWDEEDVYGIVRTAFSAGSDSTKTSMSNAIYMRLTLPRISQALRADPRLVEPFIEESLRMFGTVHFRTRVVAQDTERGEADIKQGQVIAAVHGAANRDPAVFECPHEFRLDREHPRQHLSFSVGAGICPGQHLARGELQDGVMRVFERLPDLRLDETAAQPQFTGFAFKIWSPLNIVFTPEH